MTELEKLCEQALYEEIQDLGDGKSIVRDVPTGRLLYRKVLTVYNTQVFAFLKDHKSRHVPRVESFREDENTLIVIEELVQGRTLEEILGDDGEPLSFQEKIRILTELCDGLSFLHNAQPPIIHRDLKASNIMLTEDGVVKIIDYDAAKVYISGEKKDTVLMGTHGVAAPEQYGFAASDVRTDIFGLGKLIERMLPDNADAARIVEKATHMDPKKRYSSAAQIREQILRIREHASSFDTRLERVIPGFDPRRKNHRLLARAMAAVLCAAIVLGCALAVWRFGIYPEKRREAIRSWLDAIQTEAEKEGDPAGMTDSFLVQFPYEKMSGEEQRLFRDTMEDALAEYTAADSRTEPVYKVLSDRHVDEQDVETIRQYAETERLLDSGAFETAFGKLRSCRDAEAVDAEEKWENALQRCRKKAVSAEKSFDVEGTLSDARRAMEFYALLIENGGEAASADAEDSFDRVFRAVLDQADAESRDGKHEAAEKKYVMLQDFRNTEKTAQIDLDERKKANQYSRAESFVKDENYSSARRIFEELGDYSDSAAQAQKCGYLNAEQFMQNEKYKEAAAAYALCPGYEDADAKLMEARFRHCRSVCEKPDDDAYTWIAELADAAYPGAQDVKNTMYQWHVVIKNEISLLMGSQQSTHIRVYLYGGPPDASTRIRLETIDNVTGDRSSWTSPEACSRGGYVDASYNVNSFEFSIFEREHTVNVYSDDGKKIGSWTGVFTKEFTM